MAEADDEARRAVLEALANPKYKWRTLGGVSKETGLPTDQVQNVLASNVDEIVKSSVSSESGDDLFTTREHARANAPLSARLIGALKNRGV